MEQPRSYRHRTLRSVQVRLPTTVRFMLCTLALVVVSAGLLAVTQVVAGAQTRDTRVVVAFRQAQSEAFVADFIARYGLNVEAIYLASNGFTGTQAYRTLSSQRLVASARAATLQGFTKALEGNSVRLRKFLDEHSEADLLADATLAGQARSLLNIRSQIQAVIGAARRGDSLIYAIEMHGPSPDQLERVSRNPSVRAVQRNDGSAAGRLKPEALEIEYRDSVVEGLDGRATRRAMVEILERGGK